jgi:transcriptional regulator with XRE-family HTH domain
LKKKPTQADLANVIGCGQSVMSYYLRGKRHIRLKDALKVKKTLKLPFSVFYDPQSQLKYLGKSFLDYTNDDQNANNIPNIDKNIKNIQSESQNRNLGEIA